MTSLARQGFTDQVNYQSTLESIANVPLAAEIDGRIVAMSMREGQMVRPGDPLFRLDQLQQQASSATLAYKDVKAPIAYGLASRWSCRCCCRATCARWRSSKTCCLPAAPLSWSGIAAPMAA